MTKIAITIMILCVLAIAVVEVTWVIKANADCPKQESNNVNGVITCTQWGE